MGKVFKKNNEGKFAFKNFLLRNVYYRIKTLQDLAMLFSACADLLDIYIDILDLQKILMDALGTLRTF